ncbi:hypothetical protein BST61_g10692 [Cercospora zeina]
MEDQRHKKGSQALTTSPYFSAASQLTHPTKHLTMAESRFGTKVAEAIIGGAAGTVGGKMVEGYFGGKSDSDSSSEDGEFETHAMDDAFEDYPPPVPHTASWRGWHGHMMDEFNRHMDHEERHSVKRPLEDDERMQLEGMFEARIDRETNERCTGEPDVFVPKYN